VANEWVREQREKLNWTRPDLSRRCGLSVAKIAGIELGRPFKLGEEDALRAALKLEIEKRVDDKGLVVEPNLPKDPLRWTASNPEVADALERVTDQVKLGQMVRGKRMVAPVETPFKRTYEWVDPETGVEFRRGDPVKVKADTFDEAGKANWERGAFVFDCFVTNTDTGSEWIDVVGGKPGHRLTRSFAIDRVESVKKRRHRATA
jgi:transcriptional regulator with XRE-family HTH domain